MGKRGPSKTPTEILKRRGSQLAKGREGQPQPDGDVTPPPDCLNGEARAEWLRIVPHLNEMVNIGAVDRNQLIVLCRAWAEYEKLNDQIEEAGLAGYIYKNGAGNAVRNPLVIQRDKAFKMWRRIAQDFGCSPAARADLGSKMNNDDSDNSKYFQG